jgi:hypothetical protein
VKSSGSGCVSAFIGSILGSSAACASPRSGRKYEPVRILVDMFESVYLCTDINAHASRCTLATGRQNKVTKLLNKFLIPVNSHLALIDSRFRSNL